MKRVVLLLSCLLLVYFFKPPVTFAGAQCNAQGGTCASANACGSPNTKVTLAECSSELAGISNAVCCVPQNPSPCNASGGTCAVAAACGSPNQQVQMAECTTKLSGATNPVCCVIPKTSNSKTGTSTSGTSNAGSVLCGPNNLGVQTALGCLMAGSPKLLISQLLGWGVVVGGGISFLMIVLAGFQMTTAGGDPKKVQAAREMITASVSGLLLIAFSIVLLNFFGFQILGLPGFNINLLNTP